MPDHTIFNERPESQDRALKVIERLGYTIVPAARQNGSAAPGKQCCLRKNCRHF